MNFLKLLFALTFFTIQLNAQDATPTGDQVSSIEIFKIAEMARIQQWAELAKKSTFEKKGTPYKRTPDGVVFEQMSSDPLQRGWDELYNDPGKNGRLFKNAWKPEKVQAQALLQRPCKSDQRKWLENFIAAADALEAKDAKKFKDIIVPLADDLRTLL